MPDMPVQLVVLKRLTNHLAGMTEAGGYGFDMAGRVFRGRVLLGAETELPALTILEAPDPVIGNAADDAGLVRDTPWRVFIQGFVEDDKIHPLDPVYYFKAAVQRRLAEINAERHGQPEFPAVYRLGGLIEELQVGIGVARPPQQGVSDKAFFWLPVTIRMRFDSRRPTTQVADEENP